MGSKRVRRSAEEWRSIVSRQETSGLTVEAFCQGEGLSRSVFNRWRTRLASGAAGLADRRARRTPTPFIEVGELASAPGTTIWLELGAGMVLTIARG